MVRVTVEKMTGEYIECIGNAAESVQAFKQKIAEEVQIPALCQRLTLMETDTVRINEIHKESRTYVLEQFAQRNKDLENYRHHFLELKSLWRPPTVVIDCVTALLFFLAGSPVLRINLDDDGLPCDTEWRGQCIRMFRDWDVFVRAIQNWARDVLAGCWSEAQRKEATARMELVQHQTLRHYSSFAHRMSRWMADAMDFYQQDLKKCSSSVDQQWLELVNLAPLSVYVEETAQCRMNLICDLGPVWSDLWLNTLPWEALDALGKIGEKSPERALKELSKFLLCQGIKADQLRDAALSAVLSGFHPKVEHAEMLLAALPGADSVPRGVPLKEALSALGHLGPGHFPTLERIIFSLTCGASEDRRTARKVFEELQQHCDSAAVMSCLEATLFQPKLEEQQEHPRDLPSIFECFKQMSKRDYPRVKECLLRYLASDTATDVQPWQQLRAVWAVTYIDAEDQEIVLALEAPLRERSRKGLSVAAAHALLKIAKDQRYKESVKVICEELEKGLGEFDAQDALKVLEEYGQPGDEQIIQTLLRFLRKGRRLLRSPDSVGLLHMAWNLLKTLGIDFPESCTKGTYEFLYALAWKIGRGCGKEEYKAFGKYLVSVGKSQGGVDEGIFSEVANGFKLRSVEGRQNCMKIYQELASCDGGSEAISVLLQEAQDENSMQDGRLAALHVLSELDPGINLSKDMVSALVSLCATREVAVRTAALECLRPGLDFEIPTVEILEKYLEDKDSSVRLAALKSIGKGPHFRRAYIQCLNDEASVVVQIALDLLSNFDSHQEEICPHLTPLLQHGDSQVRRMVAEYLGEMTSAASRAEALRALEADTPWSETKDEVLKARQDATERLKV